MKKKRFILVALSGGLDSTTVLAEALSQVGLGAAGVAAVGFNYGSKHNEWENAAAAKIAAYYHVPFELLNFTGVMQNFKSDLLLSGGDIPEGHYEDESMSRTVVPGRNLIFASVLAGYAWSNDLSEIWMGIHAGDHHIYEDCRPVFFAAMNAAVVAGTGERVSLVAPFLHGNKTTIVARGLQLGVPYRLTRTCYKSQRIACGVCGSCSERLCSFRDNGIEDPIEYLDRESYKSLT